MRPSCLIGKFQMGNTVNSHGGYWKTYRDFAAAKKIGKWELTKLTTTTGDMNWQRSFQLCCFKMSCTGRPAGPGLLAAARPHNSSYLQCMSLLWFSSWTPFASAEILANFEQFLISSGWWLRLRRKGGRGIFNGALRRIVGSSMGTDLDGSTDSYWWKWPLSDFLYHSYSFFIGYHWIPSSSTEVPFVEAISCDLLWANEVHNGTPHLAHGPVPKHYFSSSYINGGICRVPSWNLGVYHFWRRRLSNDSASTAGGYLPTRGGLLP